jgi:hypothetical protein
MIRSTIQSQILSPSSSRRPWCQTNQPTIQFMSHNSPTIVLNIDQHRNHLAILECFQILSSIRSEHPPDLCLAIDRCLMRLVFFLSHSESPLLTPSDRQALARAQQPDLLRALDHAHDLRTALSRIQFPT